MMDYLGDLFGDIHQFFFETMVQPVLFALNLGGYSEYVFEALGTPLIGAAEIILACILLYPLERMLPAEHWDGRRETHADIWYTLLYRLGVVPLALFLLFSPLQDSLDGLLSYYGMTPLAIDQLIPALADQPLVTFALYVVILDFADYWRHRMQHRVGWWWALHNLHHDQRRMSFWTEDRNHFVDGALEYLWFVAVGLAIGIPPAQFVAAVMLTRLVENFSHVNARISFGPIGNRLIVSPIYHRTHHALNLPQAGAGHGCNFAALFPIWDILFGTANFQKEFLPTGVPDDPVRGRAGPGLLAQQMFGLQLLWDTVTRGRTAR